MKKVYKVSYWYYSGVNFDGYEFDCRIFDDYYDFRAWVRDWKDSSNVHKISDTTYMVLLKKDGVKYDF